MIHPLSRSVNAPRLSRYSPSSFLDASDPSNFGLREVPNRLVLGGLIVVLVVLFAAVFSRWNLVDGAVAAKGESSASLGWEKRD
jgi:hypothetical protein